MMDGSAFALIGIVSVLLLVFMHVPIGVAMGTVGVVGFGMMTSFSSAMNVAVIEAGSVLTNFDMAIIPLFLLMGAFVVEGGMADDLYKIAEVGLGRMRGGLAAATILSCGAFGAVAGSATSTTATFSRIAVPQMTHRGYSPGFSGGIVAVGGTLGVMIPPSIVMAIYALMTEQFVIDLFVAAVIPAVMAVIFYIVVIALVGSLRKDAFPRSDGMTREEKRSILRSGWSTILILAMITVAIYSGVMTLVEAAAFGAVLSLVLAIIRRRITWSSLSRALLQSGTTTVMIYVSIMGASILSTFIGLTQVAGTMVDYIGALSLPPMAIILVFVGMYLVLGAFFDEVAAMMLTLPFVYPVVIGLGFDPLWWGIINVVVVNLGMITPPIGLNILLINSLFPTIGLRRLFGAVMPFIVVDLIRLGLLLAFPALSLWLPALWN